MVETNETGKPSHPGNERASFDLLHVGTSKAWEQFVDEFDLELEKIKYSMRDDNRQKMEELVWYNDDVYVRTHCNPITGERMNIQRENDPGFAAYVLIEGESSTVQDVYEYLCDIAESYDDKSGSRWIV